MKLKILGSSSAGNCYLLDNGTEALMIECGMPFRAAQRAVDFDISRIAACILSHEHGDHAKYVRRVLEARIPCYMSRGTAEALHIDDNPLVHVMTELKQYRVGGGFIVRGFDVQHDAAEPFGYLIHHRETGTVLFATDTYYVRYRFENLSNILIECNYRMDLIERNHRAGRIAKAQYERTLQSHLSYEHCRDMLMANDLKKVNNIVLIHLSDANSHAEEFRQGIRALAVNKHVHIADKNIVIDFNKTPF